MKNFNFIRIEQLLSPPVQKINYKFSPPPEKTNDAILIYPRAGDEEEGSTHPSRFSTISRFCTPSQSLPSPTRQGKHFSPLSLSLSLSFFLYFLLFFFLFFRNKNLRFRPVPERPGSNRLCPGGYTANINFQIHVPFETWVEPIETVSKPFPNDEKNFARSLARSHCHSFPSPRSLPFPGNGSTRIDDNWQSRATALFRFALLALREGNI